MKKILLTILIMISSFLSFSQNKKDVGIKAMFHIGYDRFFAVKHINLLFRIRSL